MKDRILLIEDDEIVVNLLIDVLRLKNLSVDYVTKGMDGIEKIKKEDYSFVILDLQLPDIDGFKVLEKIKEIRTSLPVIIITGLGTTENIVKAIKMGADDFIEKPFEIERLLETVDKTIKTLNLEKEITKLKMVESILDLNKTIITLSEPTVLFEKVIKILDELYHPEKIGIYLYNKEEKKFILKRNKLRIPHKIILSYKEDEILDLFHENETIIYKVDFSSIDIMLLLKSRDRILGLLTISFSKDKKIREEEIKFFQSFGIQIGIGLENSLLLEQIKNSYVSTIASLVKSLEAKDKYTKGHSEEVAYYSVMIGKNLGFSEDEIEILRNSSYLHDLGKLGIKDEILLKPSKLNEQEFEIIKKHPLITVQILEPLNLKKEEKEACLYHHEKIDGSGYPFGLKGENIPIYARIISVADAFSAMTSDRPYRKKLDIKYALEELKKNAGRQFDEQIVEIFLNTVEKEKGGEQNERDRNWKSDSLL